MSLFVSFKWNETFFNVTKCVPKKLMNRRMSMRQALISFSVFQTMILFSKKERVYIQKG